MIKKYFVFLLIPKLSYFLLLLLFTTFLLSSIFDKWIYVNLLSSIVGIYGSALAGREIFRKGIKKLVYEVRHKNYGSMRPNQSEREEDKQTDLDAEAKACGTLLILVSAFLIFLTEFIKL